MRLRIAADVFLEDKLTEVECRHLNWAIEAWTKYPDLPRVLIIASDPSKDADENEPALACYGKNGIQLKTTRILLKEFKLPSKIYDVCVRFNVYPTCLGKFDGRFIPNTQASAEIIDFCKARMRRLFGNVPRDERPMWIAALGQQAIYATARHFVSDINNVSGNPEYKKLERIGVHFARTQHPANPNVIDWKDNAEVIEAWLTGGLRECSATYRKQEAVRIRIRFEEEKRQTVEHGDTALVQFLYMSGQVGKEEPREGEMPKSVVTNRNSGLPMLCKLIGKKIGDIAVVDINGKEQSMKITDIKKTAL